MLPRLLPYQANPVRIDTGSLPIDTRIEQVEIDAVPYYRSGLLLDFAVQRANGALLTLVLDDGAPMPVGSVVSIVGQTTEFPVAQRGEAYVTGLAEKNRLRARWRDQQCEFDVDLRGELGSQPRIGPLTCSGVRR
jgi:outer membrane usher protein